MDDWVIGGDYNSYNSLLVSQPQGVKGSARLIIINTLKPGDEYVSVIMGIIGSGKGAKLAPSHYLNWW